MSETPQHANNSFGEMLGTNKNANYSSGGIIITTQNDNYFTGGIIGAIKNANLLYRRDVGNHTDNHIASFPKFYYLPTE